MVARGPNPAAAVTSGAIRVADTAPFAYGARVHPIEHLRYVARSGGLGGHALVRETMYALASLGADHADLLISCRRILGRHPTAGPLWAACARLVTAAEPARLAWDLVDGDPVDVEALGRYVPADAALLPPAEWADEAIVAAALARARSVDDERLDDLLDDPTIVLVDDGTGSAERVRRTFSRRSVQVVVVDPTELDGAPIVIEPALVAVGTIIAASTVAATVAHAVDSPIWVAVADDDVLPAAVGAEALARVADDPGWAGIDPDLVAGIISESGSRLVDELVSVVPVAPELLRPPI